jgi:hypothetical protein
LEIKKALAMQGISAVAVAGTILDAIEKAKAE